METILLELIAELRRTERLDDKFLAKLIQLHNRQFHDATRRYAKKRLLPFYLNVKNSDPERWASWNIDPALEQRLVRVLQVKPRRTASGVATITVITKPWKCSSNCLYCPNDVRMPKSYLSEEPACQRAERNFFDPYLQVTSRLRALTQMGHVTDKVELIILGGTWCDYPEAYQIWFVSELFRALNDGDAAETNAQERRNFYEVHGLSNRKEDLQVSVAPTQAEVDTGELTYNQAIDQLYFGESAWQDIATIQTATLADLDTQHRTNETAAHRVVGLVIETRPDTITSESLRLIRRLGCTKVQMGIQTLDANILRANHRRIDVPTIERALALTRLYGFKLHTHFMANLYGSTPEADIADYRRFVTEPAFLPDEVKLYPCVLIGGTQLCAHYEGGSWQPYSEEELVRVLAANTTNTPAYTRISRMIRDFSAPDIAAGNKKTNLRQMVEAEIERQGAPISEMRYREISTADADISSLKLEELPYDTTVSREVFLQWVTPEGKIAGFLRLSLPQAEFVQEHAGELPIGAGEAMIREVHVYGRVAALGTDGSGAQHLGLGRQLIERARAIALEQGFTRLNVISSVGTREYYRHLGFQDGDLYQWMEL